MSASRFDAETGAPIVDDDRPRNWLECGLPIVGSIVAAFFVVAIFLTSFWIDDEQSRRMTANQAAIAANVARTTHNALTIERQATQITALEARVQRIEDAAAGSDPIIRPTPTAPPYCCGGGAAVAPPEYVPTIAPTAEHWQGAGGVRR